MIAPALSDDSFIGFLGTSVPLFIGVPASPAERLLDSRLKSHAAQQVGVARVAAQVIVNEPNRNIRQLTFPPLKVLFKPGKRLILVAKPGIDTGDKYTTSPLLRVFAF